jgi:hypothetical protein
MKNEFHIKHIQYFLIGFNSGALFIYSVLWPVLGLQSTSLDSALSCGANPPHADAKLP